MRRVLALLMVAAACRREAPAPPRAVGGSSSVPRVATPALPSPSKRPTTTTPQQCGGDGSYDAALACFRSAAHWKFSISDVNNVRVTGELRRPTPGAETLRYTTNDGTWQAVTKPNGIAWTHNGQPAKSTDAATRLYQRMTIFPDPQKREGWPQRLDDDVPVNGVPSNRYHFTDANNGDVYDVWVSTASGDIVRVRIGTWMMDLLR